MCGRRSHYSANPVEVATQVNETTEQSVWGCAILITRLSVGHFHEILL